jgi:hypothetical protein
LRIRLELVSTAQAARLHVRIEGEAYATARCGLHPRVVPSRRLTGRQHFGRMSDPRLRAGGISFRERASTPILLHHPRALPQRDLGSPPTDGRATVFMSHGEASCEQTGSEICADGAGVAGEIVPWRVEALTFLGQQSLSPNFPRSAVPQLMPTRETYVQQPARWPRRTPLR